MRKAKRFDVKFIAVNFTNQIVKSPYFTRINEKSEIIPSGAWNNNCNYMQKLNKMDVKYRLN